MLGAPSSFRMDPPTPMVRALRAPHAQPLPGPHRGAPRGGAWPNFRPLAPGPGQERPEVFPLAPAHPFLTYPGPTHAHPTPQASPVLPTIAAAHGADPAMGEMQVEKGGACGGAPITHPDRLRDLVIGPMLSPEDEMAVTQEEPAVRALPPHTLSAHPARHALTPICSPPPPPSPIYLPPRRSRPSTC